MNVNKDSTGNATVAKNWAAITSSVLCSKEDVLS
jgi:hypothetical protein